MDYVIRKDENNYLVQAKNSLKEHGFCIIKNFFPYEPLTKILKNFRESFSAENDIRRTGPYKYKMPNFQRLDLGDFSQVNARFSRMWTCFSWNSGGEFEEPVKRMIAFRNELFSLGHSEYIYDLEGTLLCDLPKILHYPCGGGFMNRHHDIRDIPSVSNVLLSLSKRGENFESGGVYYIDKNGQFLDLEDILDIGDLYMHALETYHGVKAIDVEKNVDLTTMQGRLAINLSLEDFII
jgi:hypothetical protein